MSRFGDIADRLMSKPEQELCEMNHGFIQLVRLMATMVEAWKEPGCRFTRLDEALADIRNIIADFEQEYSCAGTGGREAFEEWFAVDETLQDSGIEVSLAVAKDLMWIGYQAAYSRREGDHGIIVGYNEKYDPTLHKTEKHQVLELSCPICNNNLIVIEGNVADEQGMFRTLRAEVEKVLETGASMSGDVHDALTRILDAHPLEVTRKEDK